MADFFKRHLWGIILNAMNIIMFAVLIFDRTVYMTGYIVCFFVDVVLLKMQIDSKKRDLDLFLYIIATLGSLALVICGFDIVIDMISELFDMIMEIFG